MNEWQKPVVNLIFGTVGGGIAVCTARVAYGQYLRVPIPKSRLVAAALLVGMTLVHVAGPEEAFSRGMTSGIDVGRDLNDRQGTRSAAPALGRKWKWGRRA
mmetsp:Transcript_6882/g.14920  ORF Transcript_6882/g.14920 Transcript_6882/m.14920 type:complete len:101 (+) Transcript_6882:44-346(+)